MFESLRGLQKSNAKDHMRQLLRALLPLVLALCVQTSAQSTAWNTVLPASRATSQWALAGAGAIPARPSPANNCSTLGTAGQSPTFTQSVTFTQINSALAACASGKVVFLNAGTYNLTSGVHFHAVSGVTLRGAGADQTIVVPSDYDGCQGAFAGICMGDQDGEYSAGVPTGHTANWTGTNGVSGTYTQGATTVTLDSITGLSVGMEIFLDQLSDTTDPGDIYNGQFGSGTGAQQTCVSCQNPNRSGRNQFQTSLVTSITGTGPYTVTVNPPVYMPNFRTAQSPGAWWPTLQPITGDGVENMTLDGSARASGGGGLVVFYNCVQCWVKGVRTIKPLDSHIKMWYGNLFDTVRDSYMVGSTPHGGSSSQSYGVDGYTGTANLVENNIMQDVSTALQMEGQTGTVLGYNYVTNTTNYAGDQWMLGAMSEHSPSNNYQLWEGDDTVEFIADDIHGGAFFTTYYRSRSTGLQAGAIQQTVPAYNYAWNRYTTYIGNVLGTVGYHNSYQSVAGDGSSNNTCYHSVFTFNWGGNCGSWGVGGGPQDDSLGTATAIRWANYDVVNNAVLLCTGVHTPTANCLGNERGTAAPTYPGLTSPSSTLPATFYNANYTNFWQTPFSAATPYPPIGPDVTTGSGPGGHTNLIPAHIVYQNLVEDPVYTIANPVTAASCSTSSGVPVVTLTSVGAVTLWNSNLIIVKGMNPSGYNTPAINTGTDRVQVSSSDNVSVITYQLPGASCPGSYVSGGTLDGPVVFTFNASTFFQALATGSPSAPRGLSAVVQ